MKTILPRTVQTCTANGCDGSRLSAAGTALRPGDEFCSTTIYAFSTLEDNQQ